jgi:thiol-disulfide isomerase/thioredoxin
MKALLSLGVAFAGFVSSLAAQSLTGTWDAKLSVEKDFALPFPIEFATTDGAVSATFFNGDVRVTSTSGALNANQLKLDFAHYDSRLEATLENGVLKGTYGNTRGGFREFEARPHATSATAGLSATRPAPVIGGVWDIPTESAKGEKAWRFIVRQTGADVSAAILRVDGDTGTLRGAWKDDRFVLHLFDGARGSSLEIVPQPDATLTLHLRSLRGKATTYTAIRPDAARAKGLPAPTNPELHTRVKDPTEPFRFSFPDLTGKVVSNTDEKFRHKVVIVNITGSWCPNCHDEAPFLAELYKKYRSLGLEIVAVDFEDAEQLKKLTRLPAFIKKYGIDYTYLLAGETKELQAKFPQAENLNAWPTTFFLGRDGRVRAVHAGFAAPAAGEFHSELVKNITHTVETLLAETPPARVSASN